ncbi:MAG: actin-binding WH2 domain-containing protein [Anaerolineae bacterium]|nr:actin-binding WH2 domain-containing protein [Anaerolineae bacterium]
MTAISPDFRRFAHHFTIIEAILRDRAIFFNEIRDDVKLGGKIRAMLISCIGFLAAYGAVMGAAHSPMQAVSSMVKLPVLFLVTLIICTPSLYFFNLLFGSRQTLPQSVSLILTAMTTTAVLLFGFAPVTLFFLLTSSEYAFFKMLNVASFGIAGLMGVIFLRQGMVALSDWDNQTGAGARRLIFLLWVILYGFVGSQMAWTLSPFIGDPGIPFLFVRQIGGNFYSDVLNSLRQLLGF